MRIVWSCDVAGFVESNLAGDDSCRGFSIENIHQLVTLIFIDNIFVRLQRNPLSDPAQKLVSIMAATTLLLGGSMGAPEDVMSGAQAGMLAADPVKNANALLRYALPIDNKPIRRIQKELEQISEDLRVPGSKSLGSVSKRIRSAQSTLDKEVKTIQASFAPGSQQAGNSAIDKLRTGLNEFRTLVDEQDKQEVPIKQQEVLSYVGEIEQAMVKGFPFEIPSEYSNLPQLKGRATMEMKVTFKDPREDNATGGIMTIVVDGYNAPLSAGDFVDLCRRGFYDGMEIQRADGFVVQTGKPSGDVCIRNVDCFCSLHSKLIFYKCFSSGAN